MGTHFDQLDILKAVKTYFNGLFLLINNPINKLRLHRCLGTKTTEANKSLKTDAKGDY